jgi:hypothetical protein
MNAAVTHHVPRFTLTGVVTDRGCPELEREQRALGIGAECAARPWVADERFSLPGIASGRCDHAKELRHWTTSVCDATTLASRIGRDQTTVNAVDVS